MKHSLIIAVLLLILYEMFLKFGPHPTHVMLQSQWQGNQYAIEKYLRDSTSKETRHKVIFVGSSLTSRLNFEEDSDCVYNLSLNGDSALTGLSAILKAPVKPDQVFVEINVTEHPINQDLIDSSSGFLKVHFAAFRIENMPINLAMSFVHSLKNDKHENQVLEPIRLNAIAMKQKGFNQTIPANIIDSRMAEFSHLVSSLELQGTKVTFFELPIFPELEFSPRVMQIRNAFKRTFPKNQTIDIIELSNDSPIQTLDGIHLSDTDARVVVGNMKRYMINACTNRQAIEIRKLVSTDS